MSRDLYLVQIDLPRLRRNLSAASHRAVSAAWVDRWLERHGSHRTNAGWLLSETAIGLLDRSEIQSALRLGPPDGSDPPRAATRASTRAATRRRPKPKRAA